MAFERARGLISGTKRAEISNASSLALVRYRHIIKVGFRVTMISRDIVLVFGLAASRKCLKPNCYPDFCALLELCSSELSAPILSSTKIYLIVIYTLA